MPTPWTQATHERNVSDAFAWLKTVSMPILSRIYTTQQGQIVFRSIPDLANGLINYAATQIAKFEDEITSLQWRDLLQLTYTPDEQGRDSWFDVREILARGADDCEGLGMLFAAWLFLKYGIEAYPVVAWFNRPGQLYTRQRGIVVHCTTLIPDVPQLPANIRATCWTKYPMCYPGRIPAGFLNGDLSIINGMPVPARYADLVGAGPHGRDLPAGVVSTSTGLMVPRFHRSLFVNE